MRILKDKEYNLFELIIKSSQQGVLSSMKKFLRENYGYNKVVANNKFIIAFGDEPVALVAHMDTVHKTRVKELYYDKDKNVMWSPQGIGADDRAGIYSIIEIIRNKVKPTIILTTDEEIGGAGAYSLINMFEKAPCDIKYLIELDRRGSEDCVFYDCDNLEFEDYINTFGFKTAWGSFSDISIICPVWGIAGVNLSIGYYDEHSLIERLDVTQMFETTEKVVKLIKDASNIKTPFIYIESLISKRYAEYLSLNKDYYDFSEQDKETDICWGCLQTFHDSMLISVEGTNERYCGDCYPKYYNTCQECGKEFSNNGEAHIYCENCRKLI